jgi:mannosyltransferase OCH1-like enzyme
MQIHLYTYNPVHNLPEGVILKDANTILNKSEIFRDNRNSFATFSDWFRIKLLFEKGGWWVDCDMICMKQFNFSNEYVIATERHGSGESAKTIVCNAVMKMPKGSDLARLVLEEINYILGKSDVMDITWTDIGSRVLSTVIADLHLENYLVSPAVFCPNNYEDYLDLSSKKIELGEGTYGIHLWNKMWEWNQLDPLVNVTEGSVVADVLLKHNRV